MFCILTNLSYKLPNKVIQIYVFIEFFFTTFLIDT